MSTSELSAEQPARNRPFSSAAVSIADVSIFLAESGTPGALDLPRASDGEPWRWVYLGRSYARLQEWETVLSPVARRVSIGERVQEIAYNLKRPYLELIADIGKGRRSVDWWTSPLAERNVTTSPLFLDCCYLKLISEMLERPSSHLCVVAESPALLESIEALARLRSIPVKRAAARGPGAWPGSRARVARYFLRVLPVVYKDFLCWARGRMQAARKTRRLRQARPATSERPRILLHTFIDESCFGADGFFKERYWGRLPAWLEEQGYDVGYIPFLLNIQRSPAEAFAWFRQSGARFLIPEDYYRATDYIAALPAALRVCLMPPGRVFLDGMDITRLVMETKIDAGKVEHMLRLRMYYALGRRMADAGFRAAGVLYTFENQALERALVMSLRRYLPDTGIIGFQHTTIFPLYLCNLIPASELPGAPIPDRVVCSGSFFRDVLVQQGLPGDRVVIGCALRYDHLHSIPKERVSPGDKRSAILLALSLEPDAVDESMLKAYEAFRDLDEVSVWIKPHPMMPTERALASLEGKELPSHFEIVDGPLSRWLPRASLLISTGSTSSFEALAMGIPVLRMGRELDLDFDSLAWFPEFRKAAYTPDEIRRQSLDLLTQDEEAADRLREFGQSLLERCFQPVTEEGMRQFLPGQDGRP